MQTFIYGNYSYNYELVKQDRKSLALTVKPDMGIILKCPLEAEDERIEKFLKRKWSWMNKQLKFFEKVQRKKYEPECISGESFFYLGRQYKLMVKRAEEDSVKLLRGILQVTTTQPVKDGNYTKKLLDIWYKGKYQIIFDERFLEMQKRFEYKSMPILKVRVMSKRWGSFLNKEQIALNPKLIHSSKECIDYVIVHELCHMKYKDHSKKFWEFLDEKYPKWQKVKDKLEMKFGMI
jgi:predicted metal-dependent hydrolase